MKRLRFITAVIGLITAVVMLVVALISLIPGGGKDPPVVTESSLIATTIREPIIPTSTTSNTIDIETNNGVIVQNGDISGDITINNSQYDYGR